MGKSWDLSAENGNLSTGTSGISRQVIYKQLDMTYGGSVECASDWRSRGRGFNPHRVQQHSFVETAHEIFSTVILPHPLIREGQLSVSGERMLILVNCLED